MIKTGKVALALFAADLTSTIDDEEEQDLFKQLFERIVNI